MPASCINLARFCARIVHGASTSSLFRQSTDAHLQLTSNNTTREDRKKAEGRDTMSAKYAFSNTLKEVRFLFCQTAEHSGPTRFVTRPKAQSFLGSIAFTEACWRDFERSRLI
jgi:hypothetical protein